MAVPGQTRLKDGDSDEQRLSEVGYGKILYDEGAPAVATTLLIYKRLITFTLIYKALRHSIHKSERMDAGCFEP